MIKTNPLYIPYFKTINSKYNRTYTISNMTIAVNKDVCLEKCVVRPKLILKNREATKKIFLGPSPSLQVCQQRISHVSHTIHVQLLPGD